MVVDYSPHRLRLVFEDMDRALWLDGSKVYYKTPRDYRPDINPADLEDVYQSYYALENIVSRKTPYHVNEALDNLKVMASVYAEYANHVLGLILEDQVTSQPPQTESQE